MGRDVTSIFNFKTGPGNLTRQEYGDFIVSQLPASNKDGHMVTQDGDLKLYLFSYFSSIVFFFGVRLFWDYMFTRTIFKKDFYIAMDQQTKNRYLEKWTSNFHHILAAILAASNFWYISDCDIWTDDVCFMTSRPYFSCVELFYIGYVTQNYYDLKYLVGDNDKTTRLVLIHHCMVVPCVLLGLLCGFGVPAVSNIALFSEISCVFMNYRAMWSTKETNEQLIPMVNQVLFLITYFFLRVILYPYCFMRLVFVSTHVFHLEQVALWRKIGLTISMTGYVIVIFMNFYWFSLIMKGLKRLL